MEEKLQLVVRLLLIAGLSIVLIGCMSETKEFSIDVTETVRGINDPAQPLVSGIPATGSIQASQARHFVIEVPYVADRLSAVLELTSGSEPDVSLFVSYGKKMTVDMRVNQEEDCWDYSMRVNEKSECAFLSPLPGTWYFTVWGDGGETEFRLTATIEEWLPSVAVQAVSTGAEGGASAMDRVLSWYMKRFSDSPPDGSRCGTPGLAPPVGLDYPIGGSAIESSIHGEIRWYFGRDAVPPAVLSVDHSGHWVHFYSWEHFERVLRSGTGSRDHLQGRGPSAC